MKAFTLCLAAILLVSAYVFIGYSHRYNSYYESGSLAGICGSLMVYIAMRLSAQMPQQQRGHITFILTGLVVGCFVAIYALRWVYQKYELWQHGLVTTGNVIGFNSVTVRHTVANYDVVYYRLNNRFYTQEFRDADNLLSTSDPVTLVCSSTDPELCDIKAYEHKGVQIEW